MIHEGDRVRLKLMPPYPASLAKESHDVFKRALGSVHRVIGTTESGRIVVHIPEAVSPEWSSGDLIMVEEEYLELVHRESG